MVDPSHGELSITRQCRLVSIARSSYYYEGRGESPLNLELMRRIDEQFLETPFYGSRQMTRWLRRQGYTVSRKRVRRLMRLLGLQAVFQRPGRPALMKVAHVAASNDVYVAVIEIGQLLAARLVVDQRRMHESGMQLDGGGSPQLLDDRGFHQDELMGVQKGLHFPIESAYRPRNRLPRGRSVRHHLFRSPPS